MPKGFYGFSNSGDIISAYGGIVTELDSYRIHKFTTSGSLIVYGSGFVDMLIVAGGGGGGNGHANVHEGMGGGAGGLIYVPNYLFQQSTVYITVGNGGGAESNGGNSSVSCYGTVAIGGGHGRGDGAAENGGSGGGGWGANSTYGLGTAGQGNNGAWHQTNGGTGGGAGGAGVVGSSPGGLGLTYSITGNPILYATGGKSYQYPPVEGTPGTGDGGGGGWSTGSIAGKAGGSGIVIIRYQI